DVSRFLFGPAGKTLALGLRPWNGGYTLCQEWDLGTGKRTCERLEYLRDMRYRGARLVALVNPDTLTFKDLPAGSLLDPLRDPVKDSYRHGYYQSADGGLLAEGLPDGRLLIWDLSRKAVRSTIQRPGLPPSYREQVVF